VEPTKLNPQFYIFKSAFSDLKASPIFGFERMSGFEFIVLLFTNVIWSLLIFDMLTYLRMDPVSADDYDGPFLDVIKIWRTGLKVIIANMAKLCSTMGVVFDKKKCEEEVITLKDLPENLNVYLSDTFEKRLASIQISVGSQAQQKQVDDVRQNIQDLCNQLLSYEIQAIFASLQNDNHYSIIDVFRNSDGCTRLFCAIFNLQIGNRLSLWLYFNPIS